MTGISETILQLTDGMTRTESIALIALLEHIGLPLITNGQSVVTQPTTTRRARGWTRAQKLAQSRRMKAYWRAKR